MFSKLVTSEIEADENIDVIREEVTEIPDADAVIIAAGPLVSSTTEKIAALSGGFVLYDAAAPIITADSIDMEMRSCFIAMTGAVTRTISTAP